MAENMKLPPGWEMETDDDGDTFYIRPDGETQWEPPDEAEGDTAAAATGDASAAMGALGSLGGKSGALGTLAGSAVDALGMAAGALPGLGGAAGALPGLGDAASAALGALGSPAGAMGALGGMASGALPPIGGDDEATPMTGKLKAAGLGVMSANSIASAPSTLPKLAKKGNADDRPVRGLLKVDSGVREQLYVYIPDALVLGPKRDKLTAAKLLSLIDLPMPQLIFNVSSGDVTQTWHFRKPPGYDLEKAKPAAKGAATTPLSDEDQQTKLDHWRTVITQKLTRVLTNTAKSCLESGAYFSIGPSGRQAGRMGGWVGG